MGRSDWHVRLSLAVFALVWPIAPGHAQAFDPSRVDDLRRTAYSFVVTDRDRFAAHPDGPDSDRVPLGVAQESTDLPLAIAPCQAAVAADARNPRLNYKLAPSLGCAVRRNRGEMLSFLDRAQHMMCGFHWEMLLAGLTARLCALL
jgi:hypothetical protein